MPSSMLHVRIDDALKTRANATLAAMGLSISDAVRLLLHRVVADQAFPLELRVHEARRDIRELDCVRLRGDLRTAGRELPSGQLGTVVHRYGEGVAFEVEVAEPFPVVVTLRPEEIERVACPG